METRWSLVIPQCICGTNDLSQTVNRAKRERITTNDSYCQNQTKQTGKEGERKQPTRGC